MELEITNDKFLIIVIGVGGTGGNFAKELCRLVSSLANKDKIKIVFKDGDVAEKKNQSRQPFADSQLDQYKAEALAEACGYAFNLDIISNTFYLEQKDEILEMIRSNPYYLPIVVGTVDNHPARQVMEQAFESTRNMIYLDSGNESWYGEVVCGIRGGDQLLAPPRSYYFPEVLTDQSLSKAEESCEVVNQSSPQHLVTNLAAANILLGYLTDILISKSVTGGITYFDVKKKHQRTDIFEGDLSV